VRDAVYIEYNRFGVHHAAVGGCFPIRCVRTHEWKLAVNLLGRDELYHLADDPGERENHIDDPAPAGIRNELHDRLLEWQARTEDLFRGPRWAQRPWRPDYLYKVQGLTTTGWHDRWETEVFA